jgi:regulator of protease activity HflC (stomatin/prohibitin superfamily)
MRKKINFLALLASFFCFFSCERIDAGHEGILVELYGSDRGVNDVSLVTGMVTYNPFTQQIYEYPTFVQTVDYPSFTINAKDGSEFKVDPTISLKIIDGHAAPIFRKYRKDISDIINGPLFNHVRDAFRIQLNKFTTDEIVSMRDSLEKAVEKQLNTTLNREGFQLEQLTSGLTYPKTIVEAVNAKNKAIQEAQKAENEVKVAQAQAMKLIVAAKAEKEANELRQQALTPAILEQMWIDKWDGSVPIYIGGGNTGTFLDISKLRRK